MTHFGAQMLKPRGIFLAFLAAILFLALAGAISLRAGPAPRFHAAASMPQQPHGPAAANPLKGQIDALSTQTEALREQFQALAAQATALKEQSERRKEEEDDLKWVLVP